MALLNRNGERNKEAGSGKGDGGDQVAEVIVFRRRKAILRMARYSLLKKVIGITALIFVLFSFIFVIEAGIVMFCKAVHPANASG